MCTHRLNLIRKKISFHDKNNCRQEKEKEEKKKKGITKKENKCSKEWSVNFQDIIDWALINMGFEFQGFMNIYTKLKNTFAK